MKLKTEIITNKQNWNQLVTDYPEANFLQSWNWGAFHENLGKTIYRLALVNGNQQTQGLATVIIERAKRGDYAAIYGGPLLDWQQLAVIKNLFKAVADLAERHNCGFIRFRPQVKASDQIKQLVKQLGARPAPMHLTADLTLQLELDQTEDELLAQMRKNHRYYIRRAKRDGITTRVSTNPADIKEFNRWQVYLAKKHDFVPFSYEFLYQQFKVFAQDDQAFLVHAEHQEELVASTFIINFNGEAVYHYGISTPKNDDLPGSYLAVWRSIQEAKQRGCQRFNFWGIAPKEAKDHRFAGVSLFKRGFGGREVAYLEAHDLSLSPKYWLTALFEWLRKQHRGL